LPGQLSRYQGVLQIFRYNWTFYTTSCFIDAIAVILLSQFVFRETIRAAVYAVAGLATFWAASSLLVSYYVYDRSPLYEWDWLPTVLKRNPRYWINIHAGLDQTSESLTRIFPRTRHRILDIYVPSEMSEPAIKRARQGAESTGSAEQANPFALPVEDRACDTIFLIFAAHELRRRNARMQFFHELWRALEQDGLVVLVEHLRDWRNFLAFGPGAFHFFSRRQWLGLGAEAGLSVVGELSITPFVRCFLFAKSTRLDDVPAQASETLAP
jgi:SAM-dependent methyltransferase